MHQAVLWIFLKSAVRLSKQNTKTKNKLTGWVFLNRYLQLLMDILLEACIFSTAIPEPARLRTNSPFIISIIPQ